jgi:hypothetical protein
MCQPSPNILFASRCQRVVQSFCASLELDFNSSNTVSYFAVMRGRVFL